jgi:hypothetical protein
MKTTVKFLVVGVSRSGVKEVKKEYPTKTAIVKMIEARHNRDDAITNSSDYCIVVVGKCSHRHMHLAKNMYGNRCHYATQGHLSAVFRMIDELCE